MEKDDFRYTLSFGDDVFGGPDWKTMVPVAVAERCRKNGTLPLLRDADGRPLKRNFVHVDDLVEAILLALDAPEARNQLFNVCMDEPVDYGEVGEYMRRTRQLGSVDIAAHSIPPGWITARRNSFSDWSGPLGPDGIRRRL